jgi:putative Ca2+/H+ antiporter (TMEM165/GDT1 family)
MDSLSSAGAAFLLVFVADLGDKPQLMRLRRTSRYCPWPVWLAATVAVLPLNLLAVLVGASLLHWLPNQLLAELVAVWFVLFALVALLASIR